MFQSLATKNLPLFSARSYAYRRELTTHDALQFIRGEWVHESRLFIAEYDFSKFFDHIDHDHIWRTLDDYQFLVTPQESSVIQAFLSSPLPVGDGYNEFDGPPRERGIPQGTSLSLFLANVAATPLDRALERLGVGFVRYADDTLIWSNDYAQICRAVDVLHSEADRIGAKLNLDKSEGIRLLVSPGAKAEIKFTTGTSFVGYDVGLGGLSIKEMSIRSIKERIEQLIFENLLRPPLEATIDPDRLAGGVDKDYVVFILQTRRYLYGDLSERELRSYQRGGVRLRRFKGRMAFYPLVDNSEQLEELDNWLRTTVWLAMRKRARLLTGMGLPIPPPLGLDAGAMASYMGRSGSTGGVVDVRLPSFRRIADALRQASQRYGPNRIGQGGSGYY